MSTVLPDYPIGRRPDMSPFTFFFVMLLLAIILVGTAAGFIIGHHLESQAASNDHVPIALTAHVNK